MASKVNEVICRQFGQSRAALPKGGWADGRTGADGQSLIPAAAPRRSTSLHEGIIEDRISKRVQSAKEAAGVGTIHILSGVNLWLRVWLRAAQTERGNARGGATKKREISRTLLSINLHFSVLCLRG